MPSREEAARRIRRALLNIYSQEYLSRYLSNFRYATKLTRSAPAQPTNEQRNFTGHLSAPLTFLLEVLETPGGNISEADLDVHLLSIERGRRHLSLATYHSIRYVIGARSIDVARAIEEIERREVILLQKERARCEELHSQYQRARKPSVDLHDEIEKVAFEANVTADICDELNEIAESLDRLMLFLKKRYRYVYRR